MKKSKPLSIAIDVPLRRYQVQKDLPPTLFRKLERVLASEVKSKDYHFKKYGWDLSWSIIQGNIYQDVFGSALEWYVMGRMLKPGDELVWKDKEFMLRRPTPKRGRITPKRGRSKSAEKDSK